MMGMRKWSFALVLTAILASCGTRGLADGADSGGMSDEAAWTLGGVLGVGLDQLETVMDGTNAEDAAKKLGSSLMIGNMAAKALIQLGYEVKVDTRYEPEDAPAGVHLQHDHRKPFSDKSIIMEAKVEYKKDWEKTLPLPTARKILGMNLPEPGPGKNIKVSFYFPDRLYRYTTILAGDFDAGTNPTWSSMTGADGIARGRLHPIKEENPLGGIRKVEEIPYRVEARVQAAQGLPKDNIDVAANAADFLLATVNGTGKVRIERHVPTEWEGSITVDRTVTGGWNVSKPLSGAMEMMGFFNTRFYGNELWTGQLTMPKVHFTTKGMGTGDYVYSVTGEQTKHRVDEGRIECEFGSQTANDTRDWSAKGDGLERGVGHPGIRVRTGDDGKPQYTVSFNGVLAGAKALGEAYSKSRGKTTHKWKDCDGDHQETMDYKLTSEFSLNQWLVLDGMNTAPHSQWLPFDPDAMTLSGSAIWDRTAMTAPGGASMHVTTSISWNLKRIVPDGPK